MNKIISIAHRGASGFAPENTLPAFTKALGLNIDMVELDVHVCKSGELIVMHDNRVDRTSNGYGRISDLTLTDIKKIRIQNKIQIPTLAEILNLINAKCKINIELKGKNTAKPVADLLKQTVKQTDWTFNDFLISSFKHKFLIAFKKNLPQIKIGMLLKWYSLIYLPRLEKLKPYSIHLPQMRLRYSNIKKLQNQGYKIFIYTVNSPSKIKKLQSMGVDGIISDYPDRLSV